MSVNEPPSPPELAAHVRRLLAAEAPAAGDELLDFEVDLQFLLEQELDWVQGVRIHRTDDPTRRLRATGFGYRERSPEEGVARLAEAFAGSLGTREDAAAEGFAIEDQAYLDFVTRSPDGALVTGRIRVTIVG